MPIPKPRSGEKENEYINRCMSAIGDEGPTNQQLAICYDKWRDNRGLRASDVRRVLATPIRAVDGHPGRVKSYAAIWGDEENMDLYGTWFTRETDFALDWYDQRPWLYDHTLNQFVRAAKIGSWKDADLDDHGLFFLGELDAHFRYLDEVEFLMTLGYLFPSSGTLSHVMQVADDGWIQRWPIAELSSTTSPAEFRIPAQVDASSRRRAAEAIRRLGGLTMTEDVQGALFPGVDLETPPAEPVAPARATETELETPPAVDAATEDRAPGEQEEDEEVTVEQLQTAVLHLDDTVRELVTELQVLREENTTLRTRLDAVELPPAQQISHLVSDRNWTDRLFCASRSGRAITNQDVGNPGEPQEPLDETDPVLAQLGTVLAGGPDQDVLSRIVASQRQ
ncbi:MAG: hypothetical protein GTN93_23535 [Anaerolineae bacterium]|nr:hypothetical protein [Anaerolineae bacterium]